MSKEIIIQHWVQCDHYPYERGTKFERKELPILIEELSEKYDVMISHTETHINLFIDDRGRRFRTR